MPDSYPTKTVPIDSIVLGKNARLFKRPRSDLFKNIKSAGLIHPPLVRPTADGHYQLVAGYRRIECVKEIREEDPKRFRELTVSVIDGDDVDIALANIGENVGREKLTIYEYGKAWQQLSDEHNLSGTEIAERTRFDPKFILSCIRVIRKLHPALLKQLSKGAEHQDPRLFSRYNLFRWAAQSHEKQIREFEELCGKRPQRKNKIPDRGRMLNYKRAVLLLASLEKEAEERPELTIAVKTARYLMHLTKTPPVKILE